MPYKCNSCPGRAFIDRHARDQHVRASHSATYECDYCNKRFMTPEARSQHINHKHPTVEFPQCNSVFWTVEARDQHAYDKHPSFECARCGRAFRTPEARDQHATDTHPTFECIHCDKVFRTAEARDQHTVDTHPTFECVRCDKVFWTAEARDQHASDKHRTFSCVHCDTVFWTPGGRDRHASDKHYVYDCDYCELAFTTADGRDQHTEDEHLTYFCAFCDKTFNSCQAQLQHQDAKHTVKCHECAQQFTSIEARAQHQRDVHLGYSSRSRPTALLSFHATGLADSYGYSHKADESTAQAESLPVLSSDSASSGDETPPPRSPDDPSHVDEPEVEEGGRELPIRCPACEGGAEVLCNCTVCKRTQPPAYLQVLGGSEGDAEGSETEGTILEPEEDLSVMGLSTLEPSARSMRLMSDYGTDAEEDAEKLRHEMVRGARVTFVDVDDQSTESDSESAICDYLDHSVHSMTRASTVASNRCTVGDNPHLSILTEADADVQNHGRSRSNSPVPQQHEETSSLRSSTPDSVGVSASVAPQGCDEDADQLSSPTPSECGSVRDLINLGGDGDTRSESPDAAADGGGGVRPHSPDGQDESVSALAVVDGNAVSGANPLRPGLDPGPVPPPRWMSASPAPDSPCSTSSFDILSRSSSPSSPFSSSSVVLITAESLPLFARENRPYLVASSGPEGPRSESSTPLLLSPVASSIDMPPSHLAFDRPLMRPPGVVDDRTEECSVSQCACESESVSVAETAPPAAGSRLSVHCRMCGRDPCEEVTATMCGHLFCKQCITEEVIAHSACPVCKHAVLLYCLFPIDLAI